MMVFNEDVEELAAALAESNPSDFASLARVGNIMRNLANDMGNDYANEAERLALRFNRELGI